MLHNKYFELLEMFADDYAKEVHGRELIGKVPMSQKGIALALDELESLGVLKSKKEGALKKYSLNLLYTEIRDVIAITEITKKLRFLGKQRKMAYIFKNDLRTVGIFGSYAKGTQKEDSDIDIFVIGKKSKNDYDEKGKALDMKISPKYFSPSEWRMLVKAKNSLCREIISSHIIIFGAERFVNSIWRDHYGFD